MNVGERALLSERGNAEPSRAGISYNLHSSAIFPKGVGWSGRSMWEEEWLVVKEKDRSSLINFSSKSKGFWYSLEQ